MGSGKPFHVGVPIGRCFNAAFWRQIYAGAISPGQNDASRRVCCRSSARTSRPRPLNHQWPIFAAPRDGMRRAIEDRASPDPLQAAQPHRAHVRPPQDRPSYRYPMRADVLMAHDDDQPIRSCVERSTPKCRITPGYRQRFIVRALRTGDKFEKLHARRVHHQVLRRVSSTQRCAPG